MSTLFTEFRFIGLITAEIQRIQKILKIFDQIILPTTISAFFFIAATTEVASSGKDVQIATIVKLIIFWLIQ
ncbi:MAG: hypothetical protein ACOZBL_00370 [Patescibacteria group bacterium]